MILGCLVGGVNAAHHRRGFFRDDQDPLGKIGPDVTSSGAGFQHNLGDQRGPDQSGAIVKKHNRIAARRAVARPDWQMPAGRGL
jgi:hypothetical protein